MGSQGLVKTTESRLLALAPALLCNIIDTLNDESLPTLRLTCKTLEAISSSQFVNAFIGIRACYVFSEARWLLLLRMLTGSSRLASKIRYICLTTSYLEFQRTRDLHTVMSRTALFEGAEYAQDGELTSRTHSEVNREEIARGSGYSTLPSPSLIHTVVSELKTHAPQAEICFDFNHDLYAEHMGNHVFDSLFLAVSASQCTISTMFLDSASLLTLRDPLVYLGEPFMPCIAFLDHLTFHTVRHRLRGPPFIGLDQNFRPKILKIIICAAINLRHLCLSFANWEEERMPRIQACSISTALLGLGFRCLSILDLRDMEMSASVLMDAVSRSQLLKELALTSICLESSAAWPQVLRHIFTTTKLRRLQLDCLESAENVRDGVYGHLRLDGAAMRDEPEDRCSTMLKGRDNVAVSLQELLNNKGPLEYHWDHIEDDDE